MSTQETKKTEETKVTKKETKEEIKARLRESIRRGELEYSGRLYIDPKYKKPGKVLRIDNADPATQEHLKKLGYTLVREPVEVGSGSLSEPANMGGSIVHVEQGIRFSQPGLLYEIDEDLLKARRELEAEMNDAQLEHRKEEGRDIK